MPDQPMDTNDVEIIEDDDLQNEDGTVIEGIYIPPPRRQFNFQQEQGQGPRLIISKIESTFFKSFAKTTIVGPFHKCFSSIIGPNGSGKSNVIDSMLFVFGYRARSIRCKKLSLLLHNSTDYRNVQSCQVTVHFEKVIDILCDNNEQFQIVPESHFSIGRTVNQDNSSNYTINGKSVTFKAVANLLRTHGIDIDHNRFLILQGEVEQISLMKPKSPDGNETGFLEYLEDVIGSDRLKEPINQFEEKINDMTEHKTEFLNRLKVAEIELDSLKKPRADALHFVNEENEIIVMKNVLFQKYIFVNNNSIEELEIFHEDLKKENETFVEKLKEIIQTKNKIVKENNSLQVVFNELKENSSQLNEKYNDLSKLDEQLQNDIIQMKKKSKKIKEDTNKENMKLEEYEMMPEKNKKLIKDYENHLLTKRKELEKHDENLNEVMASLNDDETKALQNEREQLQEELRPLQESVNEAKNAYEEASKEHSLKLSAYERESAELKKLENKFEEASKTNNEQGKLVKQTKVRYENIKPEIDQTKEELVQVKKSEEKASMDIQVLTSDLEEIRVAMSSNQSQNSIVSSLMRAQQERHISGFFGRLGDLGGVDKKYDCAVSTACGPLDNLVVDTVHNAEKCIQFLHKYSLGRATFIVLEKQEYLRNIYSRKIQYPENVCRLFDKIQIEDDKVRPAFYYALRDTLVADNLDQARRVAYSSKTRYRVVTLKGDLIEMTGTMSGGGKRPLSGRIGQKAKSISRKSFSKDEIETKDHQLQQLKIILNESQIKRKDLENKLTNLFSEEKKCGNSIQKYKTETKSLVQQVTQLEKRINEQKIKVSKSQPDPKVLEELQEIVEKNHHLMKNAEKKAKSLETQVQRVHEKILSRTEGRVKKARDIRDAVLKNIKKIEQEQTKLSVANTTAKRNTQTSLKNVENLERQLKENENQLVELREKQKSIEIQATALLKNKEQLTKELINQEMKMEDLKSKLNPINKKENEIKSKQIENNQKLESCVEKLETTKKKSKDLDKQLNSLNLRIYSGCRKFKLKELNEEEIIKLDAKALQYRLGLMENELSKKTLNLKVLDEYEEKREKYNKRASELDEMSSKLQKLKMTLANLKEEREKEFRIGFALISLKMKEIYRLISFGGDAELELVDSLDPFAEGIEFSVRPPKKSWKNITNLSGGEKTLSSLSLIFALHHYKPSPVFFMDEIDAALDPRNVSIVANYVRNCATNTQFIIISHRQNMFDLADRLVSIYKIANCTQTVALNPKIIFKSMQ